MFNPKRSIILVVVVLMVLVGILAAVLMGRGKPAGTLSRGDVREIRAIIIRSVAPWSAFKRANPRAWPALLGRRLALRSGTPLPAHRFLWHGQ